MFAGTCLEDVYVSMYILNWSRFACVVAGKWIKKHIRFSGLRLDSRWHAAGLGWWSRRRSPWSYTIRCRSAIIVELNNLPVWLETRMDLLCLDQKPSLERYINASAELFQEMAEGLGDPVLFEMASRLADASLRCNLIDQHQDWSFFHFHYQWGCCSWAPTSRWPRLGRFGHVGSGPAWLYHFVSRYCFWHG